MALRLAILRRVGIGTVALALGFSGLATATPAWAADDSGKELSKARAKFQRANELEQAGNWTGALQLLREVGQVKMTPQVRFHIALCEENLGKLVTALGGYELALAEADEVGPDFKNEVNGRIEDLRARIPKLIIKRGKGAQAAAIELDGVALGSNYIGVPFPVDTGPHTVEAKAPGHEPFSSTVEMAEKDEKTLEIVLERLSVAAPVDGSDGVDTSSAGARDGGRRAPSSKVVPLVIAGAGGVFIVASGVFFYLRQSSLSEAEEVCGAPPPADCVGSAADKAEANTLVQDANTFSTLMWGSLAVGIVGVGVGGYLYFSATSSDREQARLDQRRKLMRPGVQLVPGAPRAHAGLSVLGRF